MVTYIVDLFYGFAKMWLLVVEILEKMARPHLVRYPLRALQHGLLPTHLVDLMPTSTTGLVATLISKNEKE